MTKQIIVVNKGLKMSAGKLSAQVAHASQAFLTREFLINPDSKHAQPAIDKETNKLMGYNLNIFVDTESYKWITDSYTKVVCEVKNESELQKVVDRAIKVGLTENKDFFKIIDNGYTEFNGEKTWTCIGFRPMENEKIDKITKRLRLFKGEITY